MEYKIIPLHDDSKASMCYSKIIQTRNFKANSENPAVYIRRVNPQGETKGSISYSESQTITANPSNGTY